MSMEASKEDCAGALWAYQYQAAVNAAKSRVIGKKQICFIIKLEKQLLERRAKGGSLLVAISMSPPFCTIGVNYMSIVNINIFVNPDLGERQTSTSF